MKKFKLFLAALAAMVGLGVNAQSWTSPGSDPVTGQSYYILNVGAGQFVTAANDWGTQLSATGTDTGLLIRTDQVNNVTVGGQSLSGWELLNTNNSNKLLFRDSERWGYTDKGTQDRGFVWSITKVNGVYRLQTAAGDPAYPASAIQYAGANASLNGARVYFGYNSSSTDIDWMFLTEAQKGTANIVAKARLYRALMKAYAAGVNTDEASAVYENSSSTEEQMNDAVTSLNSQCLQAHLDNASDSDPRDITEYVMSNTDFTAGNKDGWETNYVSGNQANNIGYQDNNTYQSANGFCNKFIEAWRSGNNKIGDGYLRQTVSNMPEGKYVLECDAIATNQGNSSATTTGALLYINADGIDFTTSISTNGSAVQHFSTQFLFSGSGDVIFGLKTQNTTANWIAADNFKVTFYGVDLSAYETQLSDAVAAFEALYGTVPSTTYAYKKSSIVDENNKAWSTSSEYIAAIAAVQGATNDLNALVSEYAHYQRVRTAVLAVSSSVNTMDADTQANSATSNEDLATAITAVRNALTSYLATVQLETGQTFDLTDALIENAAPGVSGSTVYWINSDVPSLEHQLYEFYDISGATTKQTIAATLASGNYKLTAVAFTRTGYSAKLNAGEESINIATVSSNEVNNRASGDTWINAGNGETNLVFNLSEATSGLEIGLTADNANGDHWMCWRSFRLVYGDVFEPYTLVEGKMNADVAVAQTAADNAFQSNPSPATYMAVQEAIAAAQASKDAYVPFTTAINKIDAALAVATTATASTDDYDAVKATYTAASVADADVRTAIVNAYNAVIPVIKSQTAENADFTFAIQNQSFEYGDMTGWTSAESSDTGVRSTSNSTYAATGSDGDYLFNTWWQGVPLTQAVTGLPNGQYTLTASVSSDGATIYLLANGEHNDGTETGGEYPSSDTFQEATITFLVKDGNAIIGVVGGDGGDAGVHKDYVEEGYWWYKADNFRLVKNRDLTPEEAAVFPTAIALYNGETEVTEVALDVTNASVTLTPNFTPADATPSVTWTSSDETVATVSDGVVTAVSSGTAIIAVKSTLDENVGASATITVSFPESEVVSYVNDGATRMVYNLGENLIKNGSFEYSDNFYGWTAGNGAKLTSSNFSIETSGAYDGNNYLKAKQDNGQTGAGSIYTSWPVEAGKKYVFSYQMKNSSAVSNDDYIRTSLSATTTEDATSYSETFKAVSFGTDWTTLSYEFTVPEGKNYLVFSARWLKSSKSFDNFYLCEVLSDPTTEGNVQYALDAIPTANIGTGAFQYSQDAIDAANALVQGTATVEEVEAAHEAVTKLNEPEPTQAYNLVFNCEGHSATGNALTLIPNPAQTQGLYGLKYLTPANVNLAQAFYFTHTTGNKYKVHAIDTDLNERYITTQAEGYGTTWYEGIRTIDDASKAMEIEIRPNGEGLYLLWNTGANKPIAHNGNNNNDFFTNNTANFQFVETSKPSITINTTAAGWGTTMLPFAVSEIPEGVKVYTCTGAEGATLTLEEVTALEANKPYIIEGAWNATLTGDAQGTALSYTEGLLTGTYARIPAPNGAYILQKHDDKVGFFQVNTESAQPYVPANRAYLIAPTASGVKAFYLGENDLPTAIQSVFDGLVDGDAYDLAGRKVQKLQKGGVYIINGKKVVVK